LRCAPACPQTLPLVTPPLRTLAMAKAMKAMKAMKAAKGARAMSQGELVKTLSTKTGQKPKDVKGIFTALQGVACSEVAKTGKFVIPQVCMLKLKHKAARPAGKRMMFGKEVKVAAKKASKVVKAFPAKALKSAI
jgi:nucleoid DNA-binding protein